MLHPLTLYNGLPVSTMCERVNRYIGEVLKYLDCTRGLCYIETGSINVAAI